MQPREFFLTYNHAQYTPIQEALLDGQRGRLCRDLYPWQGLLWVSQKEVSWTVGWPPIVWEVCCNNSAVGARCRHRTFSLEYGQAKSQLLIVTCKRCMPNTQAQAWEASLRQGLCTASPITEVNPLAHRQRLIASISTQRTLSGSTNNQTSVIVVGQPTPSEYIQRPSKVNDDI